MTPSWLSWLWRSFLYSSSVYFCHQKQRHYFPNKGPSSQSYGFSSSHVWMWELDHKEAEHWRTDAFEVWCWRRLLRVPWTARRSNQSVLKEINPEYLLEGLMLKLILRDFWPPDGKNWLIGKDPDAGKDWRQEEKVMTEDNMVGWHHWFNGHEFWASSRSWWWTEKPGMVQSMGSQRVRHDCATELKWMCDGSLGNWDGVGVARASVLTGIFCLEF